MVLGKQLSDRDADTLLKQLQASIRRLSAD